MDDKAILLVEDNPDDQALTLRALKRHGIPNDVVVAQDGDEALSRTTGARSGTQSQGPVILPALVLLDLKMPKVGGLEVLKRLRADQRTRLIPVVILTSSLEEKDVLTSYSLGANSYIRKPVDFVEFEKTLKQLAEYWLVLNEPAPEERR